MTKMQAYFRSEFSANVCQERKTLGLPLTSFLFTFRVVVESVKWYCGTVFLSAEQKRSGEAGKDRWEWAACSWRDLRIICKNLGLEDMLDWFSGSIPVLQFRKCLWITRLSFSLFIRPQIFFKNWQSLSQLALNDRRQRLEMLCNRRTGTPWRWSLW